MQCKNDFDASENYLILFGDALFRFECFAKDLSANEGSTDEDSGTDTEPTLSNTGNKENAKVSHSTSDEDRDELLRKIEELKRDKDILSAALKRKNVELVDLNNEAAGDSPFKRARTEENEAVSTTDKIKKEAVDDETEEVEFVETKASKSRVTRSMVIGTGNIKREDIVNGDIRCPDCNKIISFADSGGCNVMTCRNHSPAFFYFCIHCKDPCPRGYSTCTSCPKRNTMEARVEAKEMRNRRSRENPEVVE